MAITKRLRFEVLRRDDHACRYCGQRAPDVELTIDHVTPTALGGTDDPSNLVAACRECNSGKTSVAPDASLVADVREDALRHAELLRQAYDVLVERLSERDAYLEDFEDAYTYKMPDDWRNSVGRWFEMGVPVELVVDAAERACAKVKTFRGTDRFAYMCGIVWNQVRLVDELAEQHRAIAGSFVTADWVDRMQQTAFAGGWERGQIATYRWLDRIDPVALVIDGKVA